MSANIDRNEILDMMMIGNRKLKSKTTDLVGGLCNGKTTDKVLRLACIRIQFLSIWLTDLVGSLKVCGLRPHTPPLTMSVA
jgi:hypothetical protein